MAIKLKPIHKDTCHCGAVELNLTLPNGIEDPRRCDCSMCRRRGAIVASVSLNNLEVVRGADVLGVYQFNTKTAKHYFCTNVASIPITSVDQIQTSLAIILVA